MRRRLRSPTAAGNWAEPRTIETARLLIRGFRPDDWRDLHEYLSRPEVLEFEPSDPSDEVECRETAAERAQGDDFWAACLISSGKVIGHVYFARTEPAELMTWELDYIFNPLYSGQGYATEACRALLEHGYGELGAHRVVAICGPGNPPSWKLLERLSLRQGICVFPPRRGRRTALA